MKRWIAWFAFGFLLLFTAASGMGSDDRGANAVALFLGIGFWFWAFITFWAVVIGGVRWLLRGRRRAPAES